MSPDRDFMAMALELARRGLGRTSPNPAVGAVLVKNGRVIGRGTHKRAGLPHAEIEALRDARGKKHSVRAKRLSIRGATLYVTLEPCAHFGRTPPCTEAIIRAGIREVVVAMRDPDRQVSGRGIRQLRRAGVSVREGVMRCEAMKLNEAYITHRRLGRPFVILKIAATGDGFVGPGSITGPAAKAFVHTLRNQIDAILVGSGTILKDNPRLTTRLRGRKGRDPIRVILDGRHRLPSSARVFHLRSDAPTLVASTISRKRGGRIDLHDLLKKLGRRGILSLLVEGGPTVWNSFLRKRLADKILLFIAPAGRRRRGRHRGHGRKTIPIGLKFPPLYDLSASPVGPDLLVEGSLKRSIHPKCSILVKS